MCLEGPNHPPIDYVVDDYVHGAIDRRAFLARATALLGVSAASVLVQACSPSTGAPAAQPTTAAAAPKAAAPTAAPPTTAPPAAAPTTAPATVAPTAAPATAAPTAAAKAATAAPAAPAAAAPAIPPYGTVTADSADITVQEVTFPGEGGVTLKGYLARPKAGTGPFPAVIVIHENQGITPHEQDVARRFAKAGFVGLAMDMLSRQGGTDKFATQQEKSAAIGQVTEEQSVADLKSATAFLKAHEAVRGSKVGITGYCWGGGRTNLAAVNIPDLSAAIPYYGAAPANLDAVKNMNAALLGLYAGNDARINASMANYEAKLKEFNKTYEMKVYDGANHAFFNELKPVFNADAAKDSWEKSVAWFNKYLRS